MRIASIDILRALTMVLMIWVNDFWSLTGVPKWLEHANATEDYLGFSDVIFPLFLFIVGLSIPYAIEYRIKLKESNLIIAKHILIRTFSLHQVLKLSFLFFCSFSWKCISLLVQLNLVEDLLDIRTCVPENCLTITYFSSVFFLCYSKDFLITCNLLGSTLWPP